ncbi:MAG: hypothetical protein WDN24_10640 [Sphingomonas sp.]
MNILPDPEGPPSGTAEVVGNHDAPAQSAKPAGEAEGGAATAPDSAPVDPVDADATPVVEPEAAEASADVVEPEAVAAAPAGAETAPPPFEPAAEPGLTREHLDAAVETIIATFRKQAGEDQFRENQNRRLHEELQGYRADPYRKAMQPIMFALTRLHAESVRTLAGFREKGASALTVGEILASFDEFREDIEMILVDNGADKFCTGKTGAKLDPARQEIVGYDSTGNEALHAAISRGERPGFEFAGRVLRREAVRVYSYAPPSEPTAGTAESSGPGNSQAGE